MANKLGFFGAFGSLGVAELDHDRHGLVVKSPATLAAASVLGQAIAAATGAGVGVGVGRRGSLGLAVGLPFGGNLVVQTVETLSLGAVKVEPPEIMLILD